MAEHKIDGWAVLANWSGALPGVRLVSEGIARQTIQRLLGFWLMWHMFGGLQAGIDAGAFGRSGAYRQREEFELIFGTPIDEFMPELGKIVRGAAERGTP